MLGTKITTSYFASRITTHDTESLPLIHSWLWTSQNSCYMILTCLRRDKVNFQVHCNITWDSNVNSIPIDKSSELQF